MLHQVKAWPYRCLDKTAIKDCDEVEEKKGGGGAPKEQH